MLFSRGGCTQGFNTFLTALKGGVLNPFGTNKPIVFQAAGWEDYLYWQGEDKKTLHRINRLIYRIMETHIEIVQCRAHYDD